MPEIIPNSKKYLKITKRLFKDNEQYLVCLKERGRPKIMILGLKEWLESRRTLRKREVARTTCG